METRIINRFLIIRFSLLPHKRNKHEVWSTRLQSNKLATYTLFSRRSERRKIP